MSAAADVLTFESKRMQSIGRKRRCVDAMMIQKHARFTVFRPAEGTEQGGRSEQEKGNLVQTARIGSKVQLVFH